MQREETMYLGTDVAEYGRTTNPINSMRDAIGITMKNHDLKRMLIITTTMVRTPNIAAETNAPGSLGS